MTQVRNPLSITSRTNTNDTGRFSPKKRQNISHLLGEKMTTPSISSWTPPTPFSVKFTPSVLQKPNLCTNGQKNSLQKDILSHPNPHTLQAPSASKRRMGLTVQYKITDQSTTGRSETSIRSPTSNISPKNFRDTPCLPNSTSDQDTITSVLRLFPFPCPDS